MNTTDSNDVPLAWRTDSLPGGDARYWTHIGRPYTESRAQRDRLIQAINAVDWLTWPGEVQWWSGMTFNAIIKRLGLHYVGQVGISRTGVEYPDPATTAPGRTVEVSVYDLVAIRQLTHHGWFTSYWLDIEPVTVCVATATEAVHREAPISLACALTRHRDCCGTTSMPVPDGTEINKSCACGCGCTTRNRKEPDNGQ